MIERFSFHTMALLCAAIIVPVSRAQQGQADLAPSGSISGTLSSIRGTVTSAATGEGLRKTFISLTSKGGSYPAQTDDKGSFVIEGIAPGTYSLAAERQGYVDSLGDQSRRITLTPGQSLTDIKVTLTPQAVISGRVVDEDGDPWTHASVSVFRSIWKDGHRDVQGFDSADPNDQGEFRIGQLPPGRYYLTAVPDKYWEARHTPGSEKAAPSRQPTWYPGSLDPAGAAPITLGVGQNLSGLEVRLRRSTVHTIRGKLAGLDGIPSPAGGNPFGNRGIEVRSASPAGDSIGGDIFPNGSFEIPGVAPGFYEASVVQGFPRFVLGAVKVQVGDRDVENLSIQLTPPRPIRGMIRLEEGGGEVAGLKVRLGETATCVLDPCAVSDADGAFEFSRVGVGNYRVVVESGKASYLRGVQLGDVASGDETISLPGPDGVLVLTLSTKGAHLTGVVSGSSDHHAVNDSDRRIVLVPNEPGGKAQVAIPDQNGTYSFEEMLRPGAYKLYGFEEVPEDLWEDAELMKEISNKGVDVRLAEADSQRVDVPLITKSELSATLQKLGLE